MSYSQLTVATMVLPDCVSLTSTCGSANDIVAGVERGGERVREEGDKGLCDGEEGDGEEGNVRVWRQAWEEADGNARGECRERHAQSRGAEKKGK